MKFQRPHGGLVKIDVGALVVLTAHRQLGAQDTEAGGVLLGRVIQGADDVIVDVATAPHPADRRGRHSFWRAWWPAQERVNAAWHASHGTCQYLGEWHTHPEPHPTPSATDISEWRKVLRSAKNAPEQLLFVIVGISSLAVWEGERPAGKPTRLERLGDESGAVR